jgi:hypothetical protein
MNSSNKSNYKFTPYVKDNIEFLQKLARTKSDKKKNSIVLQASAEQVLAILEICANIVRTNFILSMSQRKKLAEHAEFYRSLVRSRSVKTARNRIQTGSGVAIASLLVPVLSVLADHLMQKVLPKNNE